MFQTIITFFMITQKVIEILAYSLWHMKAKVLGFKVQQTRYCYHSFLNVVFKKTVTLYAVWLAVHHMLWRTPSHFLS